VKDACWRKKLKLLLSVNAGDLKMAGPIGDLAKGWQLVRDAIKIEDLTPVDKHLDGSFNKRRGHIAAGGQPLAFKGRWDRN